MSVVLDESIRAGFVGIQFKDGTMSMASIKSPLCILANTEETVAKLDSTFSRESSGLTATWWWDKNAVGTKVASVEFSYILTSTSVATKVFGPIVLRSKPRSKLKAQPAKTSENT